MAQTHLSAYGGDTRRTFDATGFFRLERTDERWWLVDPDGAAFISIGVNHAEESNLKYPPQPGHLETKIRLARELAAGRRRQGLQGVGLQHHRMDSGIHQRRLGRCTWTGFDDPIDLRPFVGAVGSRRFQGRRRAVRPSSTGRRDRRLEGPARLSRCLSPRISTSIASIWRGASASTTPRARICSVISWATSRHGCPMRAVASSVASTALSEEAHATQALWTLRASTTRPSPSMSARMTPTTSFWAIATTATKAFQPRRCVP